MIVNLQDIIIIMVYYHKVSFNDFDIFIMMFIMKWSMYMVRMACALVYMSIKM